VPASGQRLRELKVVVGEGDRQIGRWLPVFGARLAETTIGCSIPFITCKTPSGLGIQQANRYEPGSSTCTVVAVSPGVTVLGPPAKPIQAGGGVWCFIAAAIPAWKSAMVFPSRNWTREA